MLDEKLVLLDKDLELSLILLLLLLTTEIE